MYVLYETRLYSSQCPGGPTTQKGVRKRDHSIIKKLIMFVLCKPEMMVLEVIKTNKQKVGFC